MTEVKRGHSVAISGVIGFVLVALLVGIAVGAYLGLAVIAPTMYNHNSNDNSNNNQNTYNSQNSNTNPTANVDQNISQNGGTVTNNNPAVSNPTSTYGGNGSFNVAITEGGMTFSGIMTTDINCLVQQDGNNNIQLALTLTPTSVSNGLQQVILTNNYTITFNFVGTTSNSQITANAQGSIGDSSQSVTFNLNMNGSIDQNSLTFTINAPSNSQVSVTTPQQIVLYPNTGQ